MEKNLTMFSKAILLDSFRFSIMLLFAAFDVPFISLFFGACVIILWALYDHQRTNRKFRKMGIPYIPYIPIIGNVIITLFLFKVGFKNILRRDYKKLGRVSYKLSSFNKLN